MTWKWKCSPQFCRGLLPGEKKAKGLNSQESSQSCVSIGLKFSSVVESSSRMCEAMGSSPSTTEKKEKQAVKICKNQDKYLSGRD
jgi:hypothetical protein